MDALTVVHSLAPRREPFKKVAVVRLTCGWVKDPATRRLVCIWDRAAPAGVPEHEKTGFGGEGTFTLTGRPKLVFRLAWRGSIGGVDCVRGVTLNGKLHTFSRLAEVVFEQAA
jgi:hypothetical protein